MGNFAQSLTREMKSLKKQIETTHKKAIFGFVEKIVERSPVGDPVKYNWTPPIGYKPGHFVQNWQVTMSKNAIEIDGFDPGKTKSLSAMRSFIESSTVGGIYWVSNMVPYARRLEEGHSQQAPQGMVELTKIDFNGILQMAAQ